MNFKQTSNTTKCPHNLIKCPRIQDFETKEAKQDCYISTGTRLYKCAGNLGVGVACIGFFM